LWPSTRHAAVIVDCARTVDLSVIITGWFFPASQCCEFVVCV